MAPIIIIKDEFGTISPSSTMDELPKPPAVRPLRRKRAASDHHVLELVESGGASARGGSAMCEEGEMWIGHLGADEEWGDEVTTPTTVSLPAGIHLVEVAAGNLHSLFLSDEGVVFSCGFGCEGPLGHGTEASLAVPRPLAALADVRVNCIAAGGAHSLAVCVQGAVWSWGWGRYGQLGHGDELAQLTPRRIDALRKPIAQVAAGSAHSLALGADGMVYSFGRSAMGACGHSACAASVVVPTRVNALAFERVREVHAHAHASVALVASKSALVRYEWGTLPGGATVPLPTMRAETAADAPALALALGEA